MELFDQIKRILRKPFPEVNRYSLSENLNADEKEGQRLFWHTYGDACQLHALTYFH